MGNASVPVWLGTAGYAWPDWVGPFYPNGISQPRMPTFYATQFPCVEINSTFYRPPSPGQLARLANRTPPGFQFSLKVPRTISHEHGIHDLLPFRKGADELAARHRLIGFVLQFPEKFTDTPKHREWVTRVTGNLRPYTTWVEFRHHSWNRPRLGDWLRERGAELVAVDMPDLPNLFPRGVIDHGSERLYIRLHSRLVGNWHAGGPSRHDYDYPDEVLRAWIGKFKVAAPRLRDIHVIFNNCQGIQGVENARRFAELIREEAPQLRVVDPPAPAPPVQLSLFEEETSLFPA